MRFLPFLLNNNIDLIEQLYNRQKKIMYYTALKILHDPHLAEDAVHESFIKIMKHPPRFKYLSDPQTTSFCVIVCRNTALNMLKKESRIKIVDHAELDNYECVSSVEDTVIENISAENITQLVLSLPEHYKDVLYLYYNAEYKVKEIADILNISVEVVKKRLQRARAELLKQIRNGEY